MLINLETRMKKSVLVTLADQKYVLQAKQLFAGAHFNAGWTGDMLLLSHNIPDKILTWFTKRGIFIKQCQPLSDVGKWRPVSSSKLYLFTQDMKKWDKVLYLDSDIVVRASLERLQDVIGYAVAPELDRQTLFNQFKFPNKKAWMIFKSVERKLRKNYRTSDLSFNTGVIAYSTDIIKKKTFEKLVFILNLSKDISAFGEQTAQNLFFYKKWRPLPVVYNLLPLLYIDKYNIKQDKIQGINLHFAGLTSAIKPWNPENPYYREWKDNLKKADLIDRNRIPKSLEIWSKERIWITEICLRLRRQLYLPKNIRFHSTYIWISILQIISRQYISDLYFFIKKIFATSQ